MKYIHRCGAVALSAVMLMSALSGCASTTSTDATTNTDGTTTGDITAPVATFDIPSITDPFEALVGIGGDTVVATAGEIEITVSDYLYWVSYACDTILSEYYAYGITEIPWTQTVAEETFAQALQSDSINTAALYAIMPVIAQDLGLEVATADLDMLDLYLSEMETSLGSEEILTYALWEGPTTYENYRESLLADSYYSMLYSYYTEEGGELYVTDEECLAYVEDMGYYGSKHILLKTISDTVNAEGTGYEPLSDDEIAAQKTLAEEILAKLDASDEPLVLFDELMNQYSEDGRDATTGELYAPDGYTAYPGQMVTEYEEAALTLEEYEYSGIVETTYGYHIILRQPIEMSEDYRTSLSSEKMVALQDSWLVDNTVVTNEIFDQIDIQVFYENLTTFRTEMDVVLDTMTAELTTTE